MRQLTTPVSCKLPFDFSGLPRRFASIGSCFSEKIVVLLQAAGFLCVSNPNGIVYNPVSIRDALQRACKGPEYTEEDFFQFNGLWHSRLHHGAFSSPELQNAVQNAETARQAFADFLKQPCPVVLTPGTAVVFREKKTGIITANCHKVPGTEFSRELLHLSDCVSALSGAVSLLNGHPVILTVSPVRHHPGDPILNNRSKAILIEACHETAEAFPEHCAYFPAYEILHDELRDYRFYAEDMIHPSPLAEQIITESFVRACWPESAEQILSDADTAIRKQGHIQRGQR